MILHAADPTRGPVVRRYRPSLVRTLCRRDVDSFRVAGPTEAVSCARCLRLL